LAARTFSVPDLESYVRGRTKTQVREEFGPPDAIDGVDDMWFYDERNSRLTVVDPDAQKRVSVWVKFGGPDGPSDSAIYVTD
jgi:outer membrane protein assembly factor BamE (lipoprotein component of BamABCDE complex)